MILAECEQRPLWGSLLPDLRSRRAPLPSYFTTEFDAVQVWGLEGVKK